MNIVLFFMSIILFYRLPHEHLNVSAFNNLASIVGCFTKHIASLDTLLDSVDYEWLFRKVQGSPLLTNEGTKS